MPRMPRATRLWKTGRNRLPGGGADGTKRNSHEHHTSHHRANRARCGARIRGGESPVLGAQGVPRAGAVVGAAGCRCRGRGVRGRRDRARRGAHRVAARAPTHRMGRRGVLRRRVPGQPRAVHREARGVRPRLRSRTRHPSAVPAVARGARDLVDGGAAALTSRATVAFGHRSLRPRLAGWLSCGLQVRGAASAHPHAGGGRNDGRPDWIAGRATRAVAGAPIHADETRPGWNVS